MAIPLHGCAQQTGLALGTQTKLYYEVFGTGKPLVIINGGPGMNCMGVHGLAEILSKNNQVIIYDQRGTGKSEMRQIDNSTITMDLMVEDLETLRKHLGFTRWTVLGHSFGGILASFYASKFPLRIDKMILSSSGGIDLEVLGYIENTTHARLSRKESYSLFYWFDRLKTATSYYTRSKLGAALAPAYVKNRAHIPEVAKYLAEINWEINDLIWADIMKTNFNCAEALKNFDAPVLIIQSEFDIIKQETTYKTAQVLENAGIVNIANSGHYTWLDNPEVYFAEVNTFLLKP